MSHHIKKQQKIQDKVETIYYCGGHKWTTIFEDRKVYSDQESASSEIYHFGGEVVEE